MRFLKILKIIVLVLAIAALLSFIVMHLWNWLMPVIFGLHTITFWQALGLLLLSKILLAGLHCGPHRHGHWRDRMMRRWEAMTPEEREKFRQSMGGRCGFRVPETPEANK